MPFTFAPDFILTRKRKRSWQPVDPCLGFYGATSPYSPPFSSSINPTSCDFQPTNDHPSSCIQSLQHNDGGGQSGIAPPNSTSAAQEKSSPSDRDVESTVTVEDFLRWSAGTQKPTKRYRRDKKRRTVRSEGSSEYEPPKSNRRTLRRRSRSFEEHSSDPMRLRKKSRRQPRRKNTKRTVSQRHSDQPLNPTTVFHESCSKYEPSFEDLEAHISTPGPLNLVDIEDSSPHMEDSRRRYLDPRKPRPFHNAFHSPVNAQSPAHRPISLWVPNSCRTAALPRSASNHKGTTVEDGGVHNAVALTPLTFVSLEEHESMIQFKCRSDQDRSELKRPNAGVAFPEYAPLSLIPILGSSRDKQSSDDVLSTLEPIHQSTNLLPQISWLSPQFTPDAVQNQSAVSLHQSISRGQDRIRTVSGLPLLRVVSPGAPENSIAPSLVVDTAALTHNSSRAVSATHPIEPPVIPQPLSQEQQVATSRRMKPLISYFNDFLQIARTATQMQV